tara:strand:+ start:376 stop:1008 length:633 start_codon:yes stop_codon:yes gene_type:complete
MEIKDFNNQMLLGDYARTNLFTVQIYAPAKLGKFYNGGDEASTQSLAYRVKNVSLPGKTLGTIEARRFGPVFKVANDLIVDTVAMTVICSTDYREHRFFEGWIAAALGRGMDETRQIYTLSYYESYVSSVDIIPLEKEISKETGSIAEKAAHVTLIEAYPTNVGPIEMAWGDASEIATFTVTFSFRDFIWTGKGEKPWVQIKQPAPDIGL